MKLKLKFKSLFLLMIISLAAGLYTGYRIFKIPSKAAEPWVVPDSSNPNKKFISKETLINEIQQKQELIPLEVELTEKVTVDDSWGDLEVFKKFQNIYFTGKGIYSVNLDMLYEENLEVDNANKTITMNLPKPEIKTISIDEQKTIYETTQKGALRFGEVKLTPAEYQILFGHAKMNMTEKMSSSDLYEQATKGTESTLSKLISSIISTQTGEIYSIIVKFQD